MGFHIPTPQPRPCSAHRAVTSNREERVTSVPSIGLELHRQIVPRRASVDLQLGNQNAGVAPLRPPRPWSGKLCLPKAALAIWAADTPSVSPVMTPLASGFSMAPPMPVSAGTKYTPPLSGTEAAIRFRKTSADPSELSL